MCKYFFRAPLFVDTLFTYKTEVEKIFKAWRLNVELVFILLSIAIRKLALLCIYSTICQNCDDPACTILAALLKVTLIPNKRHVKSWSACYINQNHPPPHFPSACIWQQNWALHSSSIYTSLSFRQGWWLWEQVGITKKERNDCYC